MGRMDGVKTDRSQRFTFESTGKTNYIATWIALMIMNCFHYHHYHHHYLYNYYHRYRYRHRHYHYLYYYYYYYYYYYCYCYYYYYCSCGCCYHSRSHLYRHHGHIIIGTAQPGPACISELLLAIWSIYDVIHWYSVLSIWLFFNPNTKGCICNMIWQHGQYQYIHRFGFSTQTVRFLTSDFRSDLQILWSRTTAKFEQLLNKLCDPSVIFNYLKQGYFLS